MQILRQRNRVGGVEERRLWHQHEDLCRKSRGGSRWGGGGGGSGQCGGGGGHGGGRHGSGCRASHRTRCGRGHASADGRGGGGRGPVVHCGIDWADADRPVLRLVKGIRKNYSERPSHSYEVSAAEAGQV